MKRLLVTLSAIAVGLTATPVRAEHYRDHYRHHDHDDDAAVCSGAARLRSGSAACAAFTDYEG